MSSEAERGSDAQTTPMGGRTACPQCGVQLDSFTTTCAACGAVVTGGTMDAARMDRVKARLQDGVGSGYRLGDLLGRGGMGIVFQARELSLDRDVALKVLAFDPILNPVAFERFEREARLAARLDHPNIVPIFSVGQGNGIAFYTMRMVRGGSVESLVTGGKALEFGQAVSILRDVASALDYAHGQGVVHRDIKPANVLLGESGHAMVADFGIARAFSGPSSGATSATGTGVVGSPAYMSPEQWRGEKVDGRADQYALGVLAFELLAGVRPFTGDSMQELLRMHLQDDAPDIISVRHDLPAHLTDPIRRALSKQPGDRYASAREFVAALSGGASVGAGRAGAQAAPPPVTGSSATTVRTPASIARAPQTARAGPAAQPPRVPAATAEGERRSLMPWLVLLLIAGAGAGVIWKLAPPRSPAAATAPTAAPASGDASATPLAVADTLSDREKQFQVQIDEARRIALAAERRADSLATAARGSDAGSGLSARPGATPADSPDAHAHLYVFAQGGTPQVFVDGVAQRVAAPALVQVTPGRHTVQVRGLAPYLPADTTIDLAPEDTQTVVFRQRRANAQPQSGQARAGNAGTAGAKPAITIEEWIRLLGFDPRNVNVRNLTPDQRTKYRRFVQYTDSVRRASGRRP